MKFDALLKKLEKKWGGVEPRHGRAPVPDGTYQCRIDTASMDVSKNSGRLQITWGFVVLNGPEEGNKIFKYDGLETDENMAWVQGTLETLELKIPKKLSTLKKILLKAVGLAVEVQVRTKGEFTNSYISGLLEDEGEDEDEEEEEEEEESDDEDEDDDKKKKSKKAAKQDDADEDEEDDDEEEDEEKEEDEDEDEDEDEEEDDDEDEEEEEDDDEDEEEEKPKGKAKGKKKTK
jgi:hypothetical protein